MISRLARWLTHPHLHADLLAVIFGFWVVQFVGWTLMMLYVQFFDRRLGERVLYVTQISHWALVEAAGTAALSSWALLQSKHNATKLAEIQADQAPDASPGVN